MNLTSDQQLAWDYLTTDHNVFLTGEAGSGKSYLIRLFLKTKDKNFPILASTGAAAVLVGGRTFHSFMGLGILEGGPAATLERALKDKRLIKRLNSIEGFIVDEVSMLSGITLQVAETICRRARNVSEPWGGLRIVAVGDFAQLPPIERGQQGKPWAFLNPVWEESQFIPAILKQNMRTQNSRFLSILNDVRAGVVSASVQEFLNEKNESLDFEFAGTRLFPRKNQTENYNLHKLEELSCEPQTFTTHYSGDKKSIERLKKNSPLPDELVLKPEALVMLRYNDPKGRWVNGSTGTLKEIQKEFLVIELLNGRCVEIEPVTFSLLNAEGITMAGATNFPVTLAYAATIHKSQGMTIDKLMVNLKALWEPGQAYVALSRVMNPDHLWVEDWQPSSIRADPTVSQFYRSLMEQ